MKKERIATTRRCAPETGGRRQKDTPLGARLRSIFEGANNSEIARKLEVHDSTIHTIVVTGTISTQMLIKVTTLTGCDPDWLRNGEEYAPGALPN